MKKIILIIALTLLIFQMVVLATAIDIGSAAVNRSSSFGSYTFIVKENPANESGKITSVEIWAYTNLTNCEVATFYVVSGNNLSTRDHETIGAVTAGSKQTFSGLDITVQSGDYIGIYYTAGGIEMDWSGTGLWNYAGDKIPCTNQLFSPIDDASISLYGTGTTVVGWDHKWNTLTIGKWNTKEFTKWNGLE